MNRKFSKKITKEELAEFIVKAFLKSGQDILVEPEECKDNIDFLRKNYFNPQLTATIINDLSKVEFDQENLEWENGEGYAGTKDITGFNTLKNGLSYLGVCCGGDWENPLFYIVYWDGRKLRGYIPTEGNHWNTDKNSAYGNNYEDDFGFPDEKNCLKRFGVEVEDLKNMETDKIIADIQKHIVYNGV